jgi:hypothetical protein
MNKISTWIPSLYSEINRLNNDILNVMYRKSSMTLIQEFTEFKSSKMKLLIVSKTHFSNLSHLRVPKHL